MGGQGREKHTASALSSSWTMEAGATDRAKGFRISWQQRAATSTTCWCFQVCLCDGEVVLHACITECHCWRVVSVVRKTGFSAAAAAIVAILPPVLEAGEATA